VGAAGGDLWRVAGGWVAPPPHRALMCWGLGCCAVRSVLGWAVVAVHLLGVWRSVFADGVGVCAGLAGAALGRHGAGWGRGWRIDRGWGLCMSGVLLPG